MVIGNPPYVRQEDTGEFKSYFQKHYKVYQGTADLYTYFIERGVSLLREGGIFSYIVANKWMRANYGQPMRRLVEGDSISRRSSTLETFKCSREPPLSLHNSHHQECPWTSFEVTQVKTLDFQNLNDYVKENHYNVNQSTLDDKAGRWLMRIRRLC